MPRRFLIALLVVLTLTPQFASAATLRSQLLTLFKQQKLTTSQQAVCSSGALGSLVSLNATKRIVPASVSKIYTTDWAISTLPIDFRYTTDFYLNGTTLYINGGGDPHFVVEHLRSVLSTINTNKHVKITTIVFSPTFYYNWKHTPVDVQIALRQSIMDELKSDPALPVAASVSITASPTTYNGSGTHYQFQSMPLPNLLKQINDYSTNISADTLFDKLGGPSGFAAYMKKTYGVSSSTIHFETGSGLTGNYTTCTLTLSVLKHLEKQLKTQHLALTDVLTVPTVDPGVLQKRLIDPDDAKAIVAKSGTVNNHQALAGVMQTTKGSEYFAVFTYFKPVNKNHAVKDMIDTFIGSVLQQQRNFLKPFQYTPNPDAFTNYKVIMQ